MEFHVSFLVDEEHLGPVMAALYRVSNISHLSMTPVAEIDHAPQLKSPEADSVTKRPYNKKQAYSPKNVRKGRGPNGAKMADLILARMREAETLASEQMVDIVSGHNYSKKGLYSCLDRLIKQQVIVRISPGLYRLARGSDKEKATA